MDKRRTREWGIDHAGVRDAVNLTTLIRWCKIFEGSFSLAIDNSGLVQKWAMVVLKNSSERRVGTRGRGKVDVIYDSKHTDLSVLVSRAAEAVRVTEEWRSKGLARDGSLVRDSTYPESSGVEEAEEPGPGKAVEGEVIEEVIEYNWDIWKKSSGMGSL